MRMTKHWGLAVVFAAVSGLALDAAADSPTEPATKPCCFNNPAYSGTCRVEPAEDETCESILAYLNNPMSQGKTYCGGTKVRQGWQQVDCDESGSPAGSARVRTAGRGCDPRSETDSRASTKAPFFR